MDTTPATTGALRSDIEKLVAKFKSLDVVTPEMITRFDMYLNASEADVPKIHETLTAAAAEIDRIESEATAEEKNLLAEYMAEMKLIESEAKKITLQFEEAVDKDADATKEAQLLDDINNV
ncbi:MAG: hypothetical protein NTW69_20975 [Chloroflexi bacterium]|nr:hypothetical protein [Chloroflexota bacterium]